MHNAVIVPVRATRCRYRPRAWVWVRFAWPGSAAQGKPRRRQAGQAVALRRPGKTRKVSLGFEKYCIFLRHHFSLNCQVWLHCLLSHLSSDNKFGTNIREELDLHMERMPVYLLYSSILCFSYSDIILVCILPVYYIPKLGLFGIQRLMCLILLTTIAFSLAKKWF